MMPILTDHQVIEGLVGCVILIIAALIWLVAELRK